MKQARFWPIRPKRWWKASVVSAHAHLAKYSLRPDGQKDPHYSDASGLRFQQWILDTCLRLCDQDWLNYRQEIALRQPSIRLRDVIEWRKRAARGGGASAGNHAAVFSSGTV